MEYIEEESFDFLQYFNLKEMRLDLPSPSKSMDDRKSVVSEKRKNDKYFSIQKQLKKPLFHIKNVILKNDAKNINLYQI